MLTDAEVGKMVRAALDEIDQPAPWLGTLVRHEVSRGKKRQSRSLLAGVAVALITTLLVGAFAAIRVNLSPSGTHVGPSQDPVVARYRTLVDADIHAIDRSYTTPDCHTRVRCVEWITATRDATRRLLDDMSVTTPPIGLDSQATLLTGAATRFLSQLNTALELMSDSNSDYLAASGLPDITDVDLAAARIDCWPVRPVVGDHGIGCS